MTAVFCTPVVLQLSGVEVEVDIDEVGSGAVDPSVIVPEVVEDWTASAATT
jgi:hypothetical protein